MTQAASLPHGLCPPALEEGRPCPAPPCHTFQWLVREGDVFCQRSDGLRVESESSPPGPVTELLSRRLPVLHSRLRAVLLDSPAGPLLAGPLCLQPRRPAPLLPPIARPPQRLPATQH